MTSELLYKISSCSKDLRVRDESLDFKGIPASEGVNAIHSYPAMFHPRLVRRYLNIYSEKGENVLDPFMGSGVSAVEASVSERRFFGFDLNPLAVLIAQVRTTPITKKILEKNLDYLLSQYNKINPLKPDFKNINFWFSQERIISLSKLIAAIESVKNEQARKLFKVSFSETVRAVSWTRPNEFKLFRRKQPCLIPTLSIFKTIVKKNMETLLRYYSQHQIKYPPILQIKNILKDELPIDDKSISLLITSPPYGDSQTTVAYGQFSRLPLQWMGLPYQIDKESLGAKPIPIQKDIPSSHLYEALNLIKAKDKKRAMQVYSFYHDLFHAMQKVIPKIKSGGHLIWVVGNRTVKGIQLPTDLICNDLLEALGCQHLETRIRQIDNKRMPSENSPTNIPGKTAPTMKYEYIVVYKKIV